MNAHVQIYSPSKFTLSCCVDGITLAVWERKDEFRELGHP
jgi:hypothetical protein